MHSKKTFRIDIITYIALMFIVHGLLYALDDVVKLVSLVGWLFSLCGSSFPAKLPSQ
jgi:hypothetical protein